MEKQLERQAEHRRDEDALSVPTPSGVTIARFAGFDPEGRFRVMLPDHSEPVVALSTVGLLPRDMDMEVVVSYELDGARLIIIGRVHDRVTPQPASRTVAAERLVLRGDQEIELRCGDASIVLTRAGKVLIKGNFVLTRSRGANKIKGAYVDIN